MKRTSDIKKKATSKTVKVSSKKLMKRETKSGGGRIIKKGEARKAPPKPNPGKS